MGLRAFTRFVLTILAILVVVALSVVAVVRDAPLSVLIAYLILIGLLVVLARRVFPRRVRIDDL